MYKSLNIHVLNKLKITENILKTYNMFIKELEIVKFVANDTFFDWFFLEDF